jgi:hypothetical protein
MRLRSHSAIGLDANAKGGQHLLANPLPMKPGQVFGIIIRTVGLLLFILSWLYVLSGVIVILIPDFKPNLQPSSHYFLSAAAWMVISLYLIRGAPHIVRFAYPDDSNNKPA